MNKKLLKEIKEFVLEREWGQFHDPKNLAISLNLEASEVLELFQWTKNNEINPQKVKTLSGEIADVYYWLVLLAEYYSLDLDKALIEKMKVNKEKYPTKKARGNSRKYTEL
jgi:NTP pyrophosphatase (non-canonical NTP hydrolase)